MSVMKKALKPVASELHCIQNKRVTRIVIFYPSRLYCRFWNLTKSTLQRSRTSTAGREFHPAPKMFMKL